ncbi:DUF1905 domain-containing protein [Arthrobacter sp. Leaf69]|uniref:DUF1905 domain-containing protein n=1 Tax=Arthrobacter sp. Leaf69 TaxID=1736232 RepID=UPI0009E87E1D|nr:DUF1905 domain-containing protein [Arthrobacter sp. Leaf69]
MVLQYTFTARLWLYPGEAGWHFLTVPEEVAAVVREDTEAGDQVSVHLEVPAAG